MRSLFERALCAIALLIATILLSGQFLPTLAPIPVFLLLLSGAVGIGLGDTAFLAAINRLRARRVLLLGTLAPPITAIAGVMIASTGIGLLFYLK